MVTGTLKARVDKVWDAFGQGGSPTRSRSSSRSPTCSLRRLDELQNLEEHKARRTGGPVTRRIFPEGRDSRDRPYEGLRWSRFRHFALA